MVAEGAVCLTAQEWDQRKVDSKLMAGEKLAPFLACCKACPVRPSLAGVDRTAASEAQWCCPRVHFSFVWEKCVEIAHI